MINLCKYEGTLKSTMKITAKVQLIIVLENIESIFYYN